eukprot:g26904.t1
MGPAAWTGGSDEGQFGSLKALVKVVPEPALHLVQAVGEKDGIQEDAAVKRIQPFLLAASVLPGDEAFRCPCSRPSLLSMCKSWLFGEGGSPTLREWVFRELIKAATLGPAESRGTSKGASSMAVGPSQDSRWWHRLAKVKQPLQPALDSCDNA